MAQLADILAEKKRKYGSHAEIGRLLGDISGQVIGKYASGSSVPSIDFAVKWKNAFDENLLDLLMDDSNVVIGSEKGDGGSTPEKTIMAMEKTIETQDKLIAELNSQLNEYRIKESKVKK